MYVWSTGEGLWFWWVWMWHLAMKSVQVCKTSRQCDDSLRCSYWSFNYVFLRRRSRKVFSDLSLQTVVELITRPAGLFTVGSSSLLKIMRLTVWPTDSRLLENLLSAPYIHLSVFILFSIYCICSFYFFFFVFLSLCSFYMPKNFISSLMLY